MATKRVRLRQRLQGSHRRVTTFGAVFATLACAQPGLPVSEGEQEAVLSSRPGGDADQRSPAATDRSGGGNPAPDQAEAGSAPVAVASEEPPAEAPSNGSEIPAELGPLNQPQAEEAAERAGNAGDPSSASQDEAAAPEPDVEPSEPEPLPGEDAPAEATEDAEPEPPAAPPPPPPVEPEPPAEPPPPLEPGRPLSCDPQYLLCEDFESLAVGDFPGEQPWLPELPGCGSHAVEDQVQAQSGVQVLRATGQAYPECMLHADVTGELEIYVRSFVRLAAPSSESGNHVSLLEVGAFSGQDDPEIRIGIRGESACQAPGLDITIGGLTAGESTACSGLPLEADRWYCLEARYLLDPEAVQVELQLDGVLATQLTANAPLNDSWDGEGTFFKLGRAAYGGSTEFDVFHDDVVVSRAPIGCR